MWALFLYIKIYSVLSHRVLISCMPPGPLTVEESGYSWTAIGLNKVFRLSEYHPGDHFSKHIDAYFTRSSDEKMFTVNIYLNSYIRDFEGGNTRFFFDSDEEFDCCVRLVESTALIFRQPPAVAYMLHDGERVVSGYKYLIRTDIMYKKNIPGKFVQNAP